MVTRVLSNIVFLREIFDKNCEIICYFKIYFVLQVIITIMLFFGVVFVVGEDV